MHVVYLFALPLMYHIACLFKAASSCRRRLPTGVLVDLLLGPHPTLPWSLVLHYQDPPSSNTTSSSSGTPAAAGATAAGAVGLHNQLDVRGELLNSLKVSRGRFADQVLVPNASFAQQARSNAPESCKGVQSPTQQAAPLPCSLPFQDGCCCTCTPAPTSV
jgi:hypothetical protein